MCPGMQAPVPAPPGPCTAVRFTGASVSAKLRVGTLHVLLQDGSGGKVGCPGPGDTLIQRSGEVTIAPGPSKLQHM
jgi:hypothetical protein